MPFSAFGSEPDYFRFDTTYKPVASGLTLEDLLRQSAVPPPDYPEPPDPITSSRQLERERQRELRTQAILLAAQAIGQGSTSGRIGEALAGAAGGFTDLRRGEIERANADQARDYGLRREQAEREYQQRRAEAEAEQERRRAEATLELVNEISTQDPELRSRAEQAALAGDEKALRALLEEVPRRRAMADYGLSPDDPFANETMKAIIEGDSRLRLERAYKDEGLDRYFQGPGDSPDAKVALAGRIAEAQARAYAKYRQSGDEKDLRRFYEVSGIPGLVQLDEGGNPTFTPAAGAPPPPTKYQYLPDNPNTEENEGGWYDPYHPEKGPRQTKPTGPVLSQASKESARRQGGESEADARQRITATVVKRMPRASAQTRSQVIEEMLKLWRSGG